MLFDVFYGGCGAMTNDRAGTVDGYTWTAHYYAALPPMRAEVEFVVWRPDHSVFYMYQQVDEGQSFDDAVTLLEKRLFEVVAASHG